MIDTVFPGKHNGCGYERPHVHPNNAPDDAEYLPESARIAALEDALKTALKEKHEAEQRAKELQRMFSETA
jgi:hypothetical protein